MTKEQALTIKKKADNWKIDRCKNRRPERVKAPELFCSRKHSLKKTK